MPEIFDCKVEGSVGRALHQGWQEVLPREIRESPQARWVLEFDSLGHPKESREFERRNFGPGDFHNRLDWIVRRVLTPAVEQQTQFYFAALFRIGRQWRISELAIGSLSAVLELKANPRLLRPSREPLSSVGVDQARLSALLESPPDVLLGALRILFEEALNYHRGILRQTQSWWKNWDAEVRDVRRRVNTTSELLQSYANRALHEDGSRVFESVADLMLPLEATSELYSEMQNAGLEYKIARSPDFFGPSHGPFVFAALALLEGDYVHTPMFDRWLEYVVRAEERGQYLQERRLEEGRRQRLRPFVEIALNNLAAECGKKNPFEEFGVLQKPATPELYDLVHAHVLPDGAESPWLEAWKKKLQPELDSYSSKHGNPESDDPDVLESFVRSADVAIKRGLSMESIGAGETWTRYVQRLFERRWIGVLAGRIANPLKGTGKEVQSVGKNAFIKLISNVVRMLKTSGYSVEIPKEKRLELLWADRLKGGWSSEW